MTLDPTQSVAGLNAHNLRELVEDMAVQPGWHQAADLYRWYEGMCRELGMEPPTRKAFGSALRGLGYRPSIQRRDGKYARCWFISRRAWRT